MNSYQSISDRTGIPLPMLLVHWVEGGLTVYENWQETWRERMLNSPPALASIYDFQWLNADQSQDNIGRWLNPDRQNGMRFLPFGRGGAGDCYSLIPITPDTAPVALIFHDSGKLQWCARSFAEFAYIKLVEACADFDHLLDDDFSEEEALLCLSADLANVRPSLPSELAQRLEPILTRIESARNGSSAGNGMVSLVNDQELSEINERFSVAGFPEQNCVPRWQCR
ncbi:hypothetical protein [Agrobacterium sp. NPDC090283]|uniref:hypothetical protein n=1 Tax=Agrobacterium sp. NPDC090283 TaxID=3363920 RepID=UPI00383B87C5